MRFRAFIAVYLESYVRHALGDMQDELRPLCEKVRWIDEDHLHLTLKFCGQIDGQDVLDISDVIKDVYADAGNFELEVAGLRTFPDLAKKPGAAIRTIWAGVQCPQEFLDLQHELDECIMEDVGIRSEARVFVPHITLGHVKTSEGLADLQACVQANSDIQFGAVHVSKLVFFESTLTKDGPVHTALSTIHL